MMLRALLVIALAATTASAQSPDAHAVDEARTGELNRAIQQNNDAIAAHNTVAQAEYRREHAAYEAALADNARARDAAADAAKAFAAAQAQHQADMARWQAAIARPAVVPKPTPAPPKPVRRDECQTELMTGSLTRKARSC